MDQVGSIDTNEGTSLEQHTITDIQQCIGFIPEPIISQNVFSSKTILWTPNIEEIYTSNADSLEVVFDLKGLKVNEERSRIAAVAQLKTLTIQYSSMLGYVWKNVPRGIQGFQNLTSIENLK